MNDKTQWTRFADHPEIPADAEVVALARSSKCQNGELCDKPRVAVFKRPSSGGNSFGSCPRNATG